MDLKKISKYVPMIILTFIGIMVLMKYLEKPEVITKIRKDIVIEERIVEGPGKERVITRIIRDRSSTDTIVKFTKKKWIVSASSSFGQNPIFTLSVDRRILGDFYAGVYARTDTEVGINLTYSF